MACSPVLVPIFFGSLVIAIALIVGIYYLVIYLKTKKDQQYFWSPEWQKGEKEADKDIAEGNLHSFKNVEDFKNWLLKD